METGGEMKAMTKETKEAEAEVTREKTKEEIVMRKGESLGLLRKRLESRRKDHQTGLILGRIDQEMIKIETSNVEVRVGNAMKDQESIIGVANKRIKTETEIMTEEIETKKEIEGMR